MTPLKPDNETERLTALHDLHILDTPPEDAFDDLARLAAHICGVPIAAVTLVDSERQWFKSMMGLTASETARDISFCGHAILQPDLMVVPDAATDVRFADNPLVTGEPHIRFYAGSPLLTRDGHALGALCVLDRVPRRLSPEQAAALSALGRQTSSLLALRESLAEHERLSAERTEALKERQASQTLFQSALGAMEEGLTVQDRNGAVLVSNRRAEEILGFSAEGVVGQAATRDDWRYIRADGSDFPRAEHPSRVALRTGVAQSDTVMGVERSGQPTLWLSVNAVPMLHAGDSMPYAAVVSFSDITERKRANDALRRSERRLAEAQRVARIGNWEYDVATGRIVWSEEMFRLLGVDPAQGEPNYDALMTRFHPDDVPMHTAAVQTILADGQPYEFDIRVPAPNAGMRWAHVVGQAEHDGRGRVVRLFGTVMDITERRASEERFRVLFTHSSDAHMLFNEDGIIDCNPAAVSLLRCTDKSQVLALHPAVLSPERQPDGRLSLEKCVEMDRTARERGFHRFEWTQRKMDGETFPVEVTLTPVTLDGKDVLLVVWHDLTERKRAEQKIQDYAVVLECKMEELAHANARLKTLATEDGLTGLKNHRAFQERLSEEVTRAMRYSMPLSVVLLDVDHFKRYNDRFGHPVGDEALKNVARLLRENARETDMVARYGGEEFVLILPQTTGAGAHVIAQRIRRAVEAASWEKEAVTASFGVASLTLGTNGGADLVARADRALYEAKTGGRNRVVVSGPDAVHLSPAT